MPPRAGTLSAMAIQPEEQGDVHQADGTPKE